MVHLLSPSPCPPPFQPLRKHLSLWPFTLSKLTSAFFPP